MIPEALPGLKFYRHFGRKPTRPLRRQRNTAYGQVQLHTINHQHNRRSEQGEIDWGLAKVFWKSRNFSLDLKDG